ncbi:MAG: isopentenyl phosphate kinase [Anaerolineales bacterium]
MIFLKLGGSLITDKSKPLTPRIDVINRLAAEIAAAWRGASEMPLLLGHGSGSFGHYAAAQAGTHLGARTAQDWSGFISVADAARQLHQLVMRELLNGGLPAMSFPPSAMALARDGEVLTYHAAPIVHAVDRGLIPVVYGDVVFDESQGSAILSTEQVFSALAPDVQPQRLLLAGQTAGVLDDEGNTIEVLRPFDLAGLKFERVPGQDVTGGMRAKIEQAIAWAREFSQAEVLIFSASQPGLLKDVLLGATAGTRVQP